MCTCCLHYIDRTKGNKFFVKTLSIRSNRSIQFFPLDTAAATQSITMTSLPGRIGWSFTGDRTLDFARDPMDFTQRHIKAFKSRMFQGRSMNRPHAFVASNQGLKEVLEGMIQIFTVTDSNFWLLVIVKNNIKQVDRG